VDVVVGEIDECHAWVPEGEAVPVAEALDHLVLHDPIELAVERERIALEGDQEALPELERGFELTLAAAADLYCALSSPELYYVCTVDLGWTAKKHELWLGEMVESELLA
jgi:hypothetical protein